MKSLGKYVFDCPLCGFNFVLRIEQKPDMAAMLVDQDQKKVTWEGTNGIVYVHHCKPKR